MAQGSPVTAEACVGARQSTPSPPPTVDFEARSYNVATVPRGCVRIHGLAGRRSDVFSTGNQFVPKIRYQPLGWGNEGVTERVFSCICPAPRQPSPPNPSLLTMNGFFLAPTHPSQRNTPQIVLSSFYTSMPTTRTVSFSPVLPLARRTPALPHHLPLRCISTFHYTFILHTASAELRAPFHPTSPSSPFPLLCHTFTSSPCQTTPPKCISWLLYDQPSTPPPCFSLSRNPFQSTALS